MRRITATVVLLGGILWLFAANAVCLTAEELGSRGVVRLGIANEAPYAYVDADGSVTGEAPEVARGVFERMGVKNVEAVVVEFGSLIPGLKAGRFDVVAAGMYITPKRCRQVIFSEPSYRIGEGFLVKAGNPMGLHSYEDIRRNSKARLGIVAGTVELGYARTSGVEDSQIVILPDNATGLGAVKSGRVDAYAGTALTIARLADSSSAVENAQPFTDPVIDGITVAGYGAFAFRKGDGELVETFNRHLAAYVGSDAWREAVRPFGFGIHTLPDKTAAELCRP